MFGWLETLVKKKQQLSATFLLELAYVSCSIKTHLKHLPKRAFQTCTSEANSSGI